MNITAGAIVVIVILILVGFCFFFNSKIGKRVRIRASGTANEAIQKDASTPEGAKAYYNAAIEKKEDELQQEMQDISRCLVRFLIMKMICSI